MRGSGVGGADAGGVVSGFEVGGADVGSVDATGTGVFVTGRLPLLVALGAVPVVLLSSAGVPAWPAMVGWLVVCAGLAAVDVLLTADPRRVRVVRGIPSRALRGAVVDTTVTLHNSGTRRVRGTARDAWQPTAGAVPTRSSVDVDPGGVQTLAVTLRPRRRGRLTSEFVMLRAAGPWGLAGRQARVDEPGRLQVLPPFTARRHLPSRLARLRELDGATTVLTRGPGTEFDSLRPYVRGDDVRSIDWRATARAGSTMLRTWRPERDRHVVVLIDTGRTSAARIGDGPRLDAELEAALLMAAVARAAGDHVHVVLFDRVVRARVSGIEGEALLPALVDAVAPVEPTLVDTDWDAAAAQVRRAAAHPALAVVLTAQDDPAASRGFLGALPALARGTHVLVGTVTTDNPPDEATTAAAHGRARTHTAGQAYRAAAAARARVDAGRVAQAIARAGADAVSADADSLPARLVDRYLDLKALGRL